MGKSILDKSGDTGEYDSYLFCGMITRVARHCDSDKKNLQETYLIYSTDDIRYTRDEIIAVKVDNVAVDGRYNLSYSTDESRIIKKRSYKKLYDTIMAGSNDWEYDQDFSVKYDEWF